MRPITLDNQQTDVIHGSTSKNINHRLWEDRIHQGVMPTFLGALLITAVIAKLPAMKHYENQEYLALKVLFFGFMVQTGATPDLCYVIDGRARLGSTRRC